MRYSAPKSCLGVLAVIMYVLAGCGPVEQEQQPSSLPQKLQEHLADVKPTLAKYLGIQEEQILTFCPNPVSPLSQQVAREHGMDKQCVLDFMKPHNLPPGKYDWLGEVRIMLQSSGATEYVVECYLDPKTNEWLIDQVLAKDPSDVPNGFIMNPVPPAPGWNGK